MASVASQCPICMRTVEVNPYSRSATGDCESCRDANNRQPRETVDVAVGGATLLDIFGLGVGLVRRFGFSLLTVAVVVGGYFWIDYQVKESYRRMLHEARVKQAEKAEKLKR